MDGDIIIEREGIEILIRKAKLDTRDSRSRNQYYNRQTNVYVQIKSESVLDNLVNRRERPYTTWKRELLPLAAKLIKQETGLTMSQKPSWSQRLGCSCPCSPGFKTSLRDESGNVIAYNVWLTI